MAAWTVCHGHSAPLNGCCASDVVVQDAGSRLRKGASALKAQTTRSQFFFAQLAQLQQHWNIKRSQVAGARHFQIDVALPLGQHWQLHQQQQQPDTLVDVIQVNRRCMHLSLHILFMVAILTY